MIDIFDLYFEKGHELKHMIDSTNPYPSDTPIWWTKEYMCTKCGLNSVMYYKDSLREDFVGLISTMNNEIITITDGLTCNELNIVSVLK